MAISCDNYRTKLQQDELTTIATTTTTTQKKIQRKRKNCRRYFRHETLEMIKLGVNNKPARKLTDLETLMKPTIPTVESTKQPNIVVNDDDDRNKNDEKLPPICAKVSVICSPPSLQKTNDNNRDNVGGDKGCDTSETIKIHSVITINPNINQNDHQNRKLSTGFMIRDLLEMEVNQQKPPPPPPAHSQPNQASPLQYRNPVIQPMQFPMVRRKSSTRIPNSVPPQFLPPPLPLYPYRNQRPNLPHYQQYNRNLPYRRTEPSPTTSGTINTTVPSSAATSSTINTTVPSPTTSNTINTTVPSLTTLGAINTTVPSPATSSTIHTTVPASATSSTIYTTVPASATSSTIYTTVPSATTSGTMNTTFPSHAKRSRRRRNDRLPCLFERFKEPLVGEPSKHQGSDDDTHLVKCVIKHPKYNPDSTYFGSYRLKPLDKRIPQGKLCYIKEQHALIPYFDDNEKRLYLSNINNKSDDDGNNNNSGMDDKRVLIRLPKQICFNVKEQLTVEEYVIEMELVRRFAPLCFYQFYKYVTGYQIVNQQLPVSFLTFLNVHNTNGLLDLKRRYVRSLKD